MSEKLPETKDGDSVQLVRDRWRTAVAVAIAVLCVVLLALTPGYSGRTPPGTPYYNATWMFPVAALLIAGGAALTLAVRGLKTAGVAGLVQRAVGRPVWLVPVILAISFGLYVQATLLIGFFSATLVYLLILFLTTGLRRWPYVLLAAVLALALQLFFIDLLDIWMPTPAFDPVAALWPW